MKLRTGMFTQTVCNESKPFLRKLAGIAMSFLTKILDPKTVIGSNNSKVRVTEPFYLGSVSIKTPRDEGMLIAVTWLPYPPDHKHNNTGRNGMLAGTVVYGHTRNKNRHPEQLLPWKERGVVTLGGAHLDDIMPQEGGECDFKYRSLSCG